VKSDLESAECRSAIEKGSFSGSASTFQLLFGNRHFPDCCFDLAPLFDET